MPKQALLVRTLVELADNLVDDFDVVDVLTLLADRSVEALDVAAAGVMIAGVDGELHVLASSSDAMRSLELFQLQASQGPCVDCYRTGRPIVNVDLAAVNGLWPIFAPAALEAGFRSVHSLPMRLRGRTVGALNMFRADPGVLEDDDVTAAQALADVATITILQHKSSVDAQRLNEQLQGALLSRIIIEQAKGRISEAAAIDMDDAFKRLRAHARTHNLLLADVARSIADGSLSPRSLDPHDQS